MTRTSGTSKRGRPSWPEGWCLQRVAAGRARAGQYWPVTAASSGASGGRVATPSGLTYAAAGDRGTLPTAQGAGQVTADHLECLSPTRRGTYGSTVSGENCGKHGKRPRTEK